MSALNANAVNAQSDTVRSYQSRGSAPRQLRHITAVRCSLVIVAALVGLALAPGSAAHAERTEAPVATGIGGDIGPIAGIYGDLLKALQRAKDHLDRSRTDVDTQLGPLQEPTASSVALSLDGAEDEIGTILDPNSYPSLTPPEAGSADTSTDPSQLPDYAAECVDLIDDAITEMNASTPDHEVIGSLLRTIEYLMPDYRDLGGV